MSHQGNDEIKERLWEQVESMTDAEVLDQAVDIVCSRSLENYDVEHAKEFRMSFAELQHVLFLQMWNDYPES